MHGYEYTYINKYLPGSVFAGIQFSLLISQQSGLAFRSFSISFDLYEDNAPSQGFYRFNNCQKFLISWFRVENLKQTLFVKIFLKNGSSRQKRWRK